MTIPERSVWAVPRLVKSRLSSRESSDGLMRGRRLESTADRPGFGNVNRLRDEQFYVSGNENTQFCAGRQKISSPTGEGLLI